MSHWHHTMVDGSRFWIGCQWLALPRSFSQWQLIKNLAPSTIMWYQFAECNLTLKKSGRWSQFLQPSYNIWTFSTYNWLVSSYFVGVRNYIVSWALPILNFHAYLNLEGKNIHISKQNFFRFVKIIMNWKFVTPVIEGNNYCLTMTHCYFTRLNPTKKGPF